MSRICRLSDTAAQYESKFRNTESMPLVFKFGNTLVHLLFFKLRIHLSHDMRGNNKRIRLLHYIDLMLYNEGKNVVAYDGDLVRKTNLDGNRI